MIKIKDKYDLFREIENNNKIINPFLADMILRILDYGYTCTIINKNEFKVHLDKDNKDG